MPLQNFAPYVGNGYLGAWVHLDKQISGDKFTGVEPIAAGSALYIKQGRHLNQSIPYEPILSINVDGGKLLI